MPNKLSNKGKMPATHNGQTPVAIPPTTPAPVRKLSFLHFLLSLYLIKTKTEFRETKIPIAKVKIIEIASLSQFTVAAYFKISGIVL